MFDEDLNGFDGTIYGFDSSDGSWDIVTADSDVDVNALEAYVLTLEEGESASATLQFDDSEPAETAQLGLVEGFNFITPTQAVGVNDNAFRTTQDALTVQNPFAEPSVSPGKEDDFAGSTIGEGSNDVINPFAGYFVSATGGVALSDVNTGMTQQEADDVLGVTGLDAAFFAVEDLQPVDATVDEGQVFDVSANITNNGELSDEQDVELRLEPEGDVVESQTVELTADESVTVVFNNVSVDTPGEYNHTVASEDDSLSGDLTVEEVEQAEPAFFSVEVIDPKDATVDVDEEFLIDVDIDNLGNQPDEQEIELRLEPDGEPIASQTLQLDSDGFGGVTFENVSVDEPGEYNHTVASEDDEISGNLSVLEQDDDAAVVIQHDQTGSAARGSLNTVAEKLVIAPEDSDEQVRFGADANTTFEIVNATGHAVSIEPTSETDVTFEANSTQFDIYDGSGELRDPPEVIGDNSDETVSVSVTGDTEMFTDGVAENSEDTSSPFDEYEVRVLDSDGDVIDTTEKRLIGVGYNIGDGIQQNSSTGVVEFTVPRASLNDGIESEWDVEFSIGDENELGPVSVDNNEDDDAFIVTVDVDDVSPGQYSSAFELFDRNQNLGGFADRVVNLFEVNEISIKQTLIGGFNASDVTTTDTEHTLSFDILDVRPDDETDAPSTDRLVIDYFPPFNTDLSDVEESDVTLQADSEIDISNVTISDDEGVVIIELETELEDDIATGDSVDVSIQNVEFSEGSTTARLGLANGPVSIDDGFFDENVYTDVEDEFEITEST